MTDLLPSPDTTAILLAIGLAWWSLRRLLVQLMATVDPAQQAEIKYERMMAAVRGPMEATPTIGELEKLLNSDADAKVRITPDGKVVTETSVDAQDRV